MLKSPLLRQDTGGVIVAPAVRLAAGCGQPSIGVICPDLFRTFRNQPLTHNRFEVLNAGAVIPDGLRGTRLDLTNNLERAHVSGFTTEFNDRTSELGVILDDVVG